MSREEHFDAATSFPVDHLIWAPPKAPLDMPRQVLDTQRRWAVSDWLASLFRPLRLG